MKILNMCDYCNYSLPSCGADEIVFGIELNKNLDETKLNDAVVGCDKFEDNGERGVVFVKV